MNIFERIFGKKEPTVDSAEIVPVEGSTEVEEKTLDSIDEMERVAQTITEIRNQNPLEAFISGSKNEKALAENDARISNVIKNILNWLAVITSAETVRKDEYDSLTSQMLQLDQDLNAQVELQVKFKRAYQVMIDKQEEQRFLSEKVANLTKENIFLKTISILALVVGCVALVLSFI